jgi:hypothetical protein
MLLICLCISMRCFTFAHLGSSICHTTCKMLISYNDITDLVTFSMNFAVYNTAPPLNHRINLTHQGL